MAVAIVAGVACARRTANSSGAPSPAARQLAPNRSLRRVGFVSVPLSIIDARLIAQGYQIGHHVLDLLGGEHRLIAVTSRHLNKTFHAIIRRHDGLRVELAGIDDPKPELPFSPTRSRALEIRANITLQTHFWQRAGMAHQAQPDRTRRDDAAAALWIALRSGQRIWDGVAHDGVRLQRILCLDRDHGK